MTSIYDYGRGGRVGIGTPQANPTVEAEMAILLPPEVILNVTRLTSTATMPADRLCEYLLRLEDYLAAFDTLQLDAFGFACTASSYFIPRKQEREILDKCEARFGYPVISAADAIADALDHYGAKRIFLLSPYPPTMMEAAVRYWSARGYEVGATACASRLTDQSDTRGIYELGSADGVAALANVPLDGYDAVLISGTGMPSLPLIADRPSDIPLLSSNLCLAAALSKKIGAASPLGIDDNGERHWHSRCRAATLASNRSTK